MNLKEAYEILELSSEASPEEAKKRYRELSKKWHPDVNKSPEAEDKFKKINEAYQCVQSGKGSDVEDYDHFTRNPKNPFRRAQFIELNNIEINLAIDFKDSVLGCKKEVKYSRKTKCQNCHGEGQVRLNNGCAKCKGKGQITNSQLGMVFVITCPDCHGNTKFEDCKVCQSQGLLNADVSVNVNVPAGITNGAILRLQSMGHYAGSFLGWSDQYTDVFCRVSVKEEPGLSIEGDSVIYMLSISLLEALRGCTKTVKTIYGSREVSVPPRARNHDKLIIPKFGVGGIGDQKVVLDVHYPSDTDKLISALTDEGN